jgi:hypothetical protein
MSSATSVRLSAACGVLLDLAAILECLKQTVGVFAMMCG